MSKEKVYFHIEDSGNGKIALEVNGSGMDLINLFANVIHDSKDMASIIKMAFLAVEMNDKKDDDILSELMSGIKPTAQA